jgi:thymidylate synthase
MNNPMTMYISAETLDDVMNEVLEALLARPFDVTATRSKNLGSSSEIIGIILNIKNPRARLSRTETRGRAFSALGEFLWYMSGNNSLDFITYYIDKYDDESEDGKTVYGGYGPRLFNFREKFNQIENVKNLLKKKPSSRKAVIQLFDAMDIASAHKEIPCTCTLQFFIRQGKLHMVTTMRSNDAFWGLPHDVFAFTMLQEILARSLSVEVGEYKHAVGSLHLYKKHAKLAQQYLDEKFQSTTAMPVMPEGDPWPSVQILLGVESEIRNNKEVEMFNLALQPYWADLARLLQIHSLFKLEGFDVVKSVQQDMSSNTYDIFIERRLTDELKKKKKRRGNSK